MSVYACTSAARTHVQGHVYVRKRVCVCVSLYLYRVLCVLCMYVFVSALFEMWV